MKDIPREFLYLSSANKESPPIFGVYWPFAVASQVASRAVPLFSWWSTSPTQTTRTLHTHELQRRTNMAIPSAAYWSRLFGYQTGLTRVHDLHSFSCKMLAIHCVLWGVSSAVHVGVNRAHSFIAITSRIFHKVFGQPILWVTWTWRTFFFNVWKGMSLDSLLRETKDDNYFHICVLPSLSDQYMFPSFSKESRVNSSSFLRTRPAILKGEILNLRWRASRNLSQVPHAWCKFCRSISLVKCVHIYHQILSIKYWAGYRRTTCYL